MFLVNSRLGLFTAAPFRSSREGLHVMRAHLLPKLRCNFAEFLHKGSLKRLWILTSPTCVRLRYGHPKFSLEVFLGSVGSTTSPHMAGSSSHLRVDDPADLPTRSPYVLKPTPPVVGWPTLLRHPITRTHVAGAGIFNACCPSATPFGLALGAD